MILGELERLGIAINEAINVGVSGNVTSQHSRTEQSRELNVTIKVDRLKAIEEIMRKRLNAIIYHTRRIGPDRWRRERERQTEQNRETQGTADTDTAMDEVSE